MRFITYRDQIYQDVSLDPLSTAILDSAPLQRLGRVYQLGFAHLVYRGGTHTRLSHTVGAYHMAGVFVDNLKKTYRYSSPIPKGAAMPDDFLPAVDHNVIEDRWEVLRYLVSWAALLHDIGHIPIGHTLEDEFEGIYVRHDKLHSPRLLHLWYADPGGEDSEIRQILMDASLHPDCLTAAGISGENLWKTLAVICFFAEEIGTDQFTETLSEAGKQPNHTFADLLLTAYSDVLGRTFHPFMSDIVANTICADFVDYLGRDSANLGLDEKRDRRLTSRFFVGSDRTGKLRMALSLVDGRGKPRLDSCTAVVELVRQRYRFAEIVYYHKTKVAASAMLAKVFHLLDPPSDQPSAQDAVMEISEVNLHTAALLGAKTKATTEKALQQVEVLRIAHDPRHMLDPTVGDEGIPLILLDRVWEKLRSGVEEQDGTKIEHAFRALSLLQALSRRRLYKVFAALTSEHYKALTTLSRTKETLEGNLSERIQQFRGTSELRERLESKMAEAANLRDAAGELLRPFIVYVPPRKNQAKGIETGALDRGQVIPLNRHDAVRTEVAELNTKYAKLWRLLAFVHPAYREECAGLSRALDVLVMEFMNEGEVNGSHLDAQTDTMRDIAWYPYLRHDDREAAELYSELITMDRRSPHWGIFDSAHSAFGGRVSSQTHADVAVIAHLSEAAADKAIGCLLDSYELPDQLESRVTSYIEDAVSEPERGLELSEREFEVWHRLAALKLVASNLAPEEPDSK